MKHSLRVLVISLEYPPCSIGGYEVMCAQVCQRLEQRGHDVQVLTSAPLAVPTTGEDARMLPASRRDALYQHD